MSRQPPAGIGTAYFPSTDVPRNGKAHVEPSGQLRGLPRRRRPAMVALAIALAGGGVLVSAAVYQRADHQVPVVMITGSIPAMGVINASDLAVADVNVPAGVHVIPGSQLAQVTGEIAAVALRPGTLLAPADLTAAQPPAAGQVLIPVPLKPESMPASGLSPGDRVLIVATPGDQGQPSSSSGTQSLPAPVPAVVAAVSLATDQDGFDVVDVLVTAAAGPGVADQVSTGQFALIVTRRGG
jgi:SAF domain-containing protein